MVWNEDILSELPAPQRDEPLSLRQDIADELSDHLECAARREMLAQTQPADIETRVLARFGNPKKIAQNLWLDAMQEKLMTQKITLVLVSLVAVGSAIACGLMFSYGLNAHEELLKQNQQMLEQLATLATKEPDSPNLMEWVPVKVQLVAENAERSPGAGFTVRLHGRPISTAEEASLNELPDDSGVTDFGLVRPGSYKVFVEAPWGQELQRTFVAKPGVAHTEIVKCPTEPPTELQIRPVVEWPKELEGQPVAALFEIQGNIVTTIGKEKWSERHQFYLLVCPDGRIAKYERAFDYHHRSGRSEREALGMSMVQFHEDPVVIENSIPLRDESVEFHQIGLVKLPRAADLPGKDDRLVSLRQSHFLSPHNTFQESNQKATYTKPHLEDEAAVAKIQEVAITIDRRDAAMARALLAVEEFPTLPSIDVGISALSFMTIDKDRNFEISSEEASQNGEPFLSAFTQFPVTFPAFIPKSVEFRQKIEPQGS